MFLTVFVLIGRENPCLTLVFSIAGCDYLREYHSCILRSYVFPIFLVVGDGLGSLEPRPSLVLTFYFHISEKDTNKYHSGGFCGVVWGGCDGLGSRAEPRPSFGAHQFVFEVYREAFIPQYIPRTVYIFHQ